MKRKVLFGIAVFLLILFGTGVSAMWLLNRTSRAYTAAHDLFYQQMEDLQSLRYETSSINTHYLPAMFAADLPLPEIKAINHFNNTFFNMEVAVKRIQKRNDSDVSPSFERLAATIEKYGQRYTQVFEEQPSSREARTAALREISDLTQQISNLSFEEINHLEKQLTRNNHRLRQNTLQSNWLIGSLLAFGVAASIVTYLQANRLLVEPLVNLTASVKEIQKGNFELTLPIRNSTDEVAQLIPAFNEMAAELNLTRRATDAQLLKFDQQNRAILASFPHPIVLLNDEAQITQMNPSAEELFSSLGSLSVLPRNITKKVNRALERGEELLIERLDKALLLRVDEKERFYLPRIFRLSELENTSQGWALLLIDVTRLRFFDDMKSSLISTVSHEIKTPLTGIRMVLHLLTEKKIGELNEIQEEMLTSAKGDCERLLETLSNLLEMSRMDSGASSLNLTEVLPSALFKEVLPSFLPLMDEKKLVLKMDVPDDTPSILVDRIRITEVLNNFVSNAIKHSPKQGTITIAAKSYRSDEVRFEVYDDGLGVPEEASAHIFERFYRASGQVGIEGIGLGLSIAREIVSAHEGGIGYERTSDNRTLFYCNLPRI